MYQVIMRKGHIHRVTNSTQPYAITVMLPKCLRVLLNLPVDALTVFVLNFQSELFAFSIWACTYRKSQAEPDLGLHPESHQGDVVSTPFFYSSSCKLRGKMVHPEP